jgi:hypothetical protein
MVLINRMKKKEEFLGYRPYFPGIVVQSVRAPPCQGGSCGFEPRQSRPRRCKRSIHLSIFCEEGRKRVGSNSQREDPSFGFFIKKNGNENSTNCDGRNTYVGWYNGRYHHIQDSKGYPSSLAFFDCS